MRIRNWFSPPPAPPGFGRGKVLPEENASYLSRLVFHWLSPLLSVGFSRPLEKDDLWNLPDPLSTRALTDSFEVSFYSRCPPEERPVSVRHKIPEESRDQGPTNDASPTAPAYDQSLPKAIHETIRLRFWSLNIGGAETLRTTTPLVSKELLTWLAESYAWSRLTDDEKAAGIIPQPRGPGYGIGLGFTIFIMQEVASLLVNHYYQRGMSLGLSVRTFVIGSIFRKSLRLSGRARIEHSVGQITTMISADSQRLDTFTYLAPMLWVSPIQIIIGIALLIHNLGYSALVGVGVLVFSLPAQGILAWWLFAIRNKMVKVTDDRVRLTTEVLQGIRLIKFYAWEAFYSHRIGELRTKEIGFLRDTAVGSSLMLAIMGFVPVLSAVLSFVTYGLTGHTLNVAIIFSSLQFFNVIRSPMVMFPLVLAFLADSMVAVGRVSKFLLAEELPDPYRIDKDSDDAVRLDASFTWEAIKTDESKSAAEADEKKPEVDVKAVPPQPSEKEERDSSVPPDEAPFELKDLHLKISRGAFVAIVGRVGSGKSSILQALIGEMRRLNGEVVLGGSVAYVPQTPWIRNATLRENILFGQPDDSDRLDDIIKACCLEPDIEMLPNGVMTEIGEKGINLSGGQKARISLARAAYSPSDIILLDDPLSAVDAYVGKRILENCILDGPLSKRTRILVTHALHVLDKADYIYVVDGGQIKEEGHFTDLVNDGAVFSRIMDEYGSLEKQGVAPNKRGTTMDDIKGEASIDKKDTLMQEEERFTGAVTWKTYRDYFRFAGTRLWGPLLFVLLLLNEASSGKRVFWFCEQFVPGFWTGEKIDGFTQGQYMAVYSGLGAAQALFTFLFNLAVYVAALMAGLSMFKSSLAHVLGSPVSFFDTTPMGRILSRLSKDQDTVDAELSLTLTQFLVMFSSMIGTVALVFYTFPYLGIIFAPMAVLYYFVQVYYRRTSVETKRLDSLMRSAMYSTYSETLTGLSTIRAYREQDRCIGDAERGLDLQNMAYYMTITIQRWLGIRLDMFGNILILGITMFAAGARNTADPSKIGVVLTYTLSVTGLFSEMVNMFAQNEQNMNAVERILVYTQLPTEGQQEESEHPDNTWPDRGQITFTDVDLAYREGLPPVLKDVSFQIRPGEKVGIVGRTGAGKSSLLQALFRIVGVQKGRIDIDGIDISKLRLDTLRSRLALVPQDTTMFLGTLRDNLDPHGSRTDAELISVLRRAWLLPSVENPDPAMDAKFSLDAIVGDEGECGSNFSAGERQLLALARALVKNSRIIILDEATSNVDVETDAKIQRTIQTEFASSTLLCIAHRLNTIAYYDRILVMDAGKVAEFDTVLNLFDKEDSIFRSLCNEARLQRADLVRIRADHSV
ncbi:multidrug resistance-associated ABC transporter [Hymenopellis radicata]|nr:multidrug resistance-associated ABC transporter [Hymenopellis radicata]